MNLQYFDLGPCHGSELFGWLDDAAGNTYSQCGEDGIIDALMTAINADAAERWCCEVGAGDGIFCSNSRKLIEAGYHAVLIERDVAKLDKLFSLYPQPNEQVRVVNADVVNMGLDDCLVNAPEVIDVLSVDVDGSDYHVVNRMVDHRAKVLLIERSLTEADAYLPTMEEALQGRQAGTQALCEMLVARGYSPICATKTNVVAVLRELVPLVSKSDKYDVQLSCCDRNVVRLNLGAGDVPLEGYTNLDIKDGHVAYPLDYPDASVDEVRASHILEHFSHRQVLDVVRDWARVLKPGGTLSIAVPDFPQIMEWYREGRNDLPLVGYIMGGQVDEHDQHRCVFEAAQLEWILAEAGLVNIRPWTSEIEDCAALPVSLNRQADKPGLPHIDKVDLRDQVLAVITVPRYMLTAGVMQLIAGFSPLSIQMQFIQGAFWGHCLQQGLEAATNSPLPYVITWDYDTCFTAQDVMQLWRLMETHPEVDAVAGLQMRRTLTGPLFNIVSKDGQAVRSFDRNEFRGDLVQVTTAHMGLTMFRTDRLRDLSKPWFQDEPDPRGSWGDGSTDDDIWFWKKWHAEGRTVYVAPHVILGHVQEMVTWPGPGLTEIHQQIKDYHHNGRPVQAGAG